MNQCSCETSYYTKMYEDEVIKPGDIIAVDKDTGEATLAFNHKSCINNVVVGICDTVKDNNVYIKNRGFIDVNVTGIICIGDKLTTSKKPGYACAIRYDNKDENIFGIRSIGKVIGIYQSYDKAKVLLDIE